MRKDRAKGGSKRRGQSSRWCVFQVECLNNEVFNVTTSLQNLISVNKEAAFSVHRLQHDTSCPSGDKINELF